MKNKRIKLKLVGVFLRWCWNEPDDIEEHYQDIKTRYFFETDPEMLQLLKELNDKPNT